MDGKKFINFIMIILEWYLTLNANQLMGERFKILTAKQFTVQNIDFFQRLPVALTNKSRKYI